MNFLKKREMGFLIITIIGIIIPFITIDGNHIWLLDFVHQEFHIAGLVFTVQELHLMPFLVMFLFVGLFAITSVIGRVWCGWSCPQTIFRFVFRDLIQTYLLRLRKKVGNKQKEPDMSLMVNKIKYVVSVLLFSSLAFIVSSNFMIYFMPYDYFFEHILDLQNHSTLIAFTVSIAFIIILLVVVLKENFCIYACPYARVQSVLYDKHTYTPVYSNNRGGVIYSEDGKKQINSKKELKEKDECIACEKCVQICPTGIDIRKGLQIECIGCFGCIDACSDVMGKFGKTSLITWTSESHARTGVKTKLIRTKSVAYGIVLLIIVALLITMGSNKETMQINVNKTSRLYSIKENKIQDAYIFLFHNTTHQDHKYYFSIDNPIITINKPTKPFTLRAGKKIKKIVALSVDSSKLSTLRKKYPDGVIDIKIKAFATDDKSIFAIRDNIFIFPK